MPHLRSLVERYEDDPFELIGVNTGDDKPTYLDGLKDHKVSWLSAYQGDGSAIAKLFAVQYYPTYLVIDTDGTIVWRSGDDNNTHDSKDDAIEALVKKAKEKAGK